ncbi:tetratricopeptide repeat protein [Catalinimonas niigatensis]|uniref:tetratricopeptide repeat protein n=1 Tax=Catalinimonas niigatensis TaxID=1397264 RepID=UPI0026670010|nr:tetratricopeptide repeat protein [Catalinimonas niigatensis]WPP53505.1 tetratricopeptide repeat protein [Catalinimonas niigatensis]
MNRIFLVLISSTFFAIQGFAQVSFTQDKELLTTIEQSLDYIYNTDVATANKLNEEVGHKLPNHPVYPMLKALTIRAAHNPINLGSPEFYEMKGYLERVLSLSEEILKKDEMHPEANFFAMASIGLLAMYENDEGNHFKAVGMAKDAYTYLKNGFELKEAYPEFYFSSGLYNFYRVKYPELHPVYRPFMLFFRDGDISLGLEQLKKAYHQSIFMSPESGEYLTHIYLRYEDQPENALRYARALVKKYPKNLYFVTNFLDAAIAADQFSGLDTYVQQLQTSDRPYYQMTGKLFEGMLQEKRDHQWRAAEKSYIKSLEYAPGLKNDEAENYVSYAYAGLARIAHEEEKHDAARSLYKKALANAHYRPVTEEATAYLK